MARQVAHERHHHPGDNDRNEQSKDALLTEKAERNPRIPHVDKRQERCEDLDGGLGLVVRGLDDQGLRDLISNQHQGAGQPGDQRRS